MSPAPVESTLFDLEPIPDRGRPTRLQRLLTMGRPEVRKFAEIDARARHGVAADWAAYSVHLIDIIAGYEKAIANVTAPASNGTDTSDEAARKLAPTIDGRRAIILDMMDSWSRTSAKLPVDERGMTCKDLERALKWNHGSASARVHELLRLGYIVDTGRRRVTSTAPDGRKFHGAVCEITALGADRLRQHIAANGLPSATPTTEGSETP